MLRTYRDVGTQADRFPAQTADAYADPKRTGESARSKIYGSGGIAASMASGSSVSPIMLSIVVAAMKVSVAQSEGIRTFFASEAGQRYLQVQLDVFPKSAGWYQEFRSQAIGLGLVDLGSDRQEPLLLPMGK